MKRVWVVDDKIPLHELYAGPYPSFLEPSLVRHLVEHVPASAWDEDAVLELCRALCGADYEAIFFLSPDAMVRSLDLGSVPPHAVVFDWEYPGSNDERNCAALERLLRTSFAYVQIYTHLGEAGVEPKLSELRTRYRGRLLPTRMKSEVTPTELAQQIRNAWTGTIAGELADKVRSQVFAAVERSLVDICAVGKGAISSMSHGTVENLVHVVLSKVRDEIGAVDAEALEEIVAASHSGESSDELRRLMSAWYYFFPSDSRVRRGDLVEIDGELGLVVTAPCDLVRFPKKTGRRLTWLRAVRLDADGVSTLRAAGVEVNDVGNSIIAAHGKAGEAIVLLPNVPLEAGSRESVADYVVLCHAWESRVFAGAPGGAVAYEHLEGLRRRCTLADPFASAVVARVTSVISSPGTPDLPKGELARLKQAASQRPPTPDAQTAVRR
jgi:hypothetical protein